MRQVIALAILTTATLLALAGIIAMVVWDWRAFVFGMVVAGAYWACLWALRVVDAPSPDTSNNAYETQNVSHNVRNTTYEQ